MAHAMAFTGAQSLFAAKNSGGNRKESPSLLSGIRCHSAPFAHYSAAFGVKSGTSSGVENVRERRAALVGDGASFLEEMEFDVVVIGAGIIGLTIASRILEETTLSVAVVDAKRLCAGATGAGSLLVATSVEATHGLQAHVEEMAAAGVDAEFLTTSKLIKIEPSLEVGHEGGACLCAW